MGLLCSKTQKLVCEYLRVDFDLFFYRTKETLVDSDLRDLCGQGARNLMPAGRGGGGGGGGYPGVKGTGRSSGARRGDGHTWDSQGGGNREKKEKMHSIMCNWKSF